MRDVSVAKIGDPKHISTAATVMRSAVCGTVAAKSFDNTTSRPGAIITPVPMTKFPKRKA